MQRGKAQRGFQEEAGTERRKLARKNWERT